MYRIVHITLRGIGDIILRIIHTIHLIQHQRIWSMYIIISITITDMCIQTITTVEVQERCTMMYDAIIMNDQIPINRFMNEITDIQIAVN